MEDHQGNVHQSGGDHRLADAYHDNPLAHAFQLAQAELISDGKGDEAQGHLGDDVQSGNLLLAVKAQAGQPQGSQTVGPQQKTSDQICRDGGQTQLFCQPGHEQAAHQCE